MIRVASIKQNSKLLNCVGKLEIIKLTPEHLPVVFEIQHAGLSSPWTFENLQSTLENIHSFSFGLFLDDKLISFCLTTLVLDEVNILNFVTRLEYRRQGYANCLLQKVIALAEQQKIVSFFLEVRQSNFSAVRLYEEFGFVKLTERKDYYQNPTENALVMALNVKKQ
ncbi:MAG: ribosomal protein S18-alanine N-acetyltransferase [Deltaproteobacteria bacterium]|jgi:ribosomal-protein-alanine N-acetyltransferase|nr:ribosomal protein S18-alanine N-acetyltransferase [Deltaproteobacteria bacterium]